MAMQGFTQKIVQLMKSERLFKSQGGAIILSQMTWATKMAVELGTGVLWVICKEDDAPDLVAHIFSLKDGGCATFLTNNNPESTVKVVYNSKYYNLSPWSISILHDYEKVAIQLAFFLMFSSF
ncbi:hypothetical protein GIB67_012352 [Kingdonia uniflora]|uniref:Beta-galactosidase beta-sandwich domain-containing protein n=1 Tax=Kingdonia uniflora TaxID=39325 RepID=A0A7J7MVK0_9MAGN|nr:hypothetical protein GIB67_012352 [Kingdonia uniflora]